MTLAATVLLLQIVIIFGVPTIPDKIPTISPLPAILSGDMATSPNLPAIVSGVEPRSPELPAILSGDQSLPANMVLPRGAVPTDIAGMKITAEMLVDKGNLVDKVLMQPSLMQSVPSEDRYHVPIDQANNVGPSKNINNGQMSMQISMQEAVPNLANVGMSPYPVPMGPVNNEFTSVNINNAPKAMESSPTHDISKVPIAEQTLYPAPNGQVNNDVPSRPINIGELPMQLSLQQAIQNSEDGRHIRYPVAMDTTIGRWSSPIPAPIVLMNLQAACQSLQKFVLGTPLAMEIMTSISNMEIMASKQPKQCGMPALSASLRMFLRTCSMYTSCPVPMYVSFPTSFQPRSPAVPYMVVQPLKPNQRPNTRTRQNSNNIHTVAIPPRVPRPKRPTIKEPIMRRYPGWMYGFRALQAGLQRLRHGSHRGTTPEPTGTGDD